MYGYNVIIMVYGVTCILKDQEKNCWYWILHVHPGGNWIPT